MGVLQVFFYGMKKRRNKTYKGDAGIENGYRYTSFQTAYQ
jgi:hypothetical protein